MSETDSAGNARPFSAMPKPEPEEPETPAKEPRLRRRFLEMPEGALGFFILWLLAAAGGALIVLYWPWMSGIGAQESTAMNDRLAVLETRIGQVASGHAEKAAEASFAEERRNLMALKSRVDADEARLAALESGAGGPGGDPQAAARIAANEKALAALRSDLDTQTKTSGDMLGKLGTRMDEAEKRLPPADLAERLDSLAPKTSMSDLETRLATLETRDTAGLIRRASSLLALADLMRASERGEPFADEFGVLRALVPASPEVADLSRYAKRSVPPAAALTQRFSRDAGAILDAERSARAQGWMERAWFGMVSLVSVRRIGDIPGYDSEARVARAEAALRRGDLATAVFEVRRLDAPARAAAASWLKDAEARLAVDRDARALTGRIVAGLSSATQHEPPPQPALPK